MKSTCGCEWDPRIHKQVEIAFRWNVVEISLILVAEGERVAACLKMIRGFVPFVFGVAESSYS